MTRVDDAAKVARVDAWMSDVSDASRRWKTAKAAQRSSESVIEYLQEIGARTQGLSPDVDELMAEAVEANRRNAGRLAEEASRQAALESGFYDALGRISPPEVAEAWRMRCKEQKTWLQCSMALHYNRQHLERLSKEAKVRAYDMGLLPPEYMS